MKAERILLPLDIRKCPLDVFSVVNGFAKYPGATVTLLHVVTLNIAVRRIASMKSLDETPAGILRGWPEGACAGTPPPSSASGSADRLKKSSPKQRTGTPI